jgi:hypothetical protein
MRQIHPVAFHEKFVASGIYQYGYIDNSPNLLRIMEHWSIHQLPDQSRLIRSDWDARDEFGESRLVEVLRSAKTLGERVERCDFFRYFRFANHTNGYAQVTKSAYTFFDDHVQIARQNDDAPRQYAEMQLPNYVAVNMTINADQRFVLELARYGNGQMAVFRPNWTADASSGQIVNCAVSVLDSETLTIAAKPIFAHHYRLICADETPMDYWFNEYDTLIRYEKGAMYAVLTQYAHNHDYDD